MDAFKQKEIIQNILFKEFPNDKKKQIIYLSGDRFNFSCPYCRDSNNPYKKRGNYYIKTNTYKCFNGGCGIFKNGDNFFKQFEEYDKLTNKEKLDLQKSLEENKNKYKKYYGDVDISLFFDVDLDKYLIDRKYLLKKLNLLEINHLSEIGKYIINREHKIDNKFAWNAKRNNLFLFNLTKDDKIIGLQIRNMNKKNKGNKYYTYNLSSIWQKLLKVNDENFINECKKIDPISHVFGIGNLDFSKDIVVFEGPLDAWLWKNAVGLCSIENKFPFEMENIVYWDDWDISGRTKSVKRLLDGMTIFNWGKFLNDNNLDKGQKWDLNDLVVYLRKTGKKISRLDNYFTNDSLNIGYFI